MIRRREEGSGEGGDGIRGGEEDKGKKEEDEEAKTKKRTKDEKREGYWKAARSRPSLNTSCDGVFVLCLH